MKKFILLLVLLTSLNAFAGAPKATPERIEKGKALFTINCLVCHGEKMDGNGPAGGALDPKPRNLITDKLKKGDSVEQIFQTITSGLGTGMMSYGHLPEEDRWALAHYISSKRKTKK